VAMYKFVVLLLLTLLAVGFLFFRADISSPVDSSSAARDPGVRGGAAGAGGPIAGLTET